MGASASALAPAQSDVEVLASSPQCQWPIAELLARNLQLKGDFRCLRTIEHDVGLEEQLASEADAAFHSYKKSLPRRSPDKPRQRLGGCSEQRAGMLQPLLLPHLHGVQAELYCRSTAK